MMHKKYAEADCAADAFYGKDAASFAAEVECLVDGDQKLMAAFHRTRQNYLQGRFTRNLTMALFNSDQKRSVQTN